MEEISIEDILSEVDKQLDGVVPQYEQWQQELIDQLDVLRQDVALTYMCPVDKITIDPVTDIRTILVYDIKYQSVTFRITHQKQLGNLILSLKVMMPDEEDSWKTERHFYKVEDTRKNIKQLFAQWLLDNMSYLRQIRSKKD